MRAIERLFKGETELIDLHPKRMDEDERIKCIRGKTVLNFYSTLYFLFTEAVQVKFGLTKEQLVTVWGSLLECIKSKRRNLKAKIRRSKLTTFPLK